MLEQIKASAGSGKTYTLTRRFLQELSKMGQEQNTLPCRSSRLRGPGAFSEILAMTFTNKAATEMKARVLSSLKEIALRQNDEPDHDTGINPAQARAWVDIILRRYDALNIRTIDSFLNLLLQISAINLDIPPDFELAFDEREFFDPLYDELLDRATRNDEEVSDLLRECAVYLLNTVKSAGLTPRGRIREMLLEVLEHLQNTPPERLPSTDRPTLEAARVAAFEELEQSLVAIEAEMDRLELEPKKDFTKFIAKILAAEPGEALPTSVYSCKDSFQDCCNTKQKPLVDDDLESAYADFCGVYKNARTRITLYDSALLLLPFVSLAILLLPDIKRLEHESGQIPASLKETLAGKVLNAENGVSEACCRLGSRLNHILIDEFQDTSRGQWQAILPLAEECLSRGGSLRYVGDVKQAIYSWRGGDSSLFDEIVQPCSELTAIEPEPLLTPLEYNWRSSPEVVRHNNNFFSRLADPELAYLVIKALLHKDYPNNHAHEAAGLLSRAFAGTAQKIPDENNDAQPGLVRIQRVGGTGKEQLEEDVRQKLGLLFSGLMRRRRPGDIALLVRNRAEAALVANWLSEWGIGVVTEHSFKLAGNPLVKRLIALMRWLDYPPDDLSFSSFVGGAEIFGRASGLTPEKFFSWEASVRKREKKPLALFRHFQNDFPSEWAVWLEPFHRRSGLMSAYDMISEIYNRFSLLGRAPGHAVYLRRFLELVLGAEKNGYSSLSGFLEFWDGKGQEEKIPAPDNPDAVSLMTIHKAKGLEFPVVIMPFHRFSGQTRPEIAVCFVDGTPLLVKSGPELGSEYYRGKNSAAVESMNLLYVAWTRAGEELHLFVGGSEHDQASAGLTKALELLLNCYNFSGDGVYSSGSEPDLQNKINKSDSFLDTPPFIESAPPDDEDWQPMSWLPKLKIFRGPVPETVYDERVRGILFHNCLENLYIDENSTDNFSKAIIRTVDFIMSGFHMPLDHSSAARAELIAALEWFCSLPRARYWLTHGRAEQTIMDENGANYRMDMLVEEEDGSLLVLEYKSGQPRPEYAEQIGRYLRLLQPGTGKKVKGILVYLDLQKLEEVAA